MYKKQIGFFSYKFRRDAKFPQRDNTMLKSCSRDIQKIQQKGENSSTDYNKERKPNDEREKRAWWGGSLDKIDEGK